MKGDSMNRMKTVMVVILVLLIAAAGTWLITRQKGQAVVWAVSMVQLAETDELQNKIASTLGTKCNGMTVAFERKVAMGDEAKLKEVLKQADDGQAKVILAVGLDVAQMAYKETSKTPVVFCGVPYPSAYGLLEKRAGAASFVGINTEVPMASYCAELKKLREKWADAGIILPQDYLAGQKESDAFTKAFVESFGGAVHVITIDAKTCSQLMDVVGAYNLIASKKVSLYYAIDDGNIAKYLNMLIRQCRNQQIPVIGGGEETVQLGAMMAAVPDQGEIADSVAGMVARLLKGESCDSVGVKNFRITSNTNVMAELGLSK